MTADVRVGDKVRVALEGTVTHVSETAFSIDEMWAHYHNSSLNWTVEILERSVPKVGDIVKGTELDRLPVWSVVLHDSNACQLFMGGWYMAGAAGPGPRFLPRDEDYRVLYVPEDGPR